MSTVCCYNVINKQLKPNKHKHLGKCFNASFSNETDGFILKILRRKTCSQVCCCCFSFTFLYDCFIVFFRDCLPRSCRHRPLTIHSTDPVLPFTSISRHLFVILQLTQCCGSVKMLSVITVLRFHTVCILLINHKIRRFTVIISYILWGFSLDPCSMLNWINVLDN